MKRRSSVAPVRPCELLDYQRVASEASEANADKKPVVPRQLDFTSNPSRRSMLGKPKSFRAVENVPQRSRISLSGRPRHDVSVMDGVSLLGLTMNESCDDVTIQIPKPVAALTSVPVRPIDTSQVMKKLDNEPKKCDTSVRNKTFGSCNKSLPSLNETKIPKPKIRTTEKTTRTSAELNSTAAFEEEEIAALTSTPHPDRKSKSIVPLLSSSAENSDLAEQMKLFIMDQRSLMQAVKLSCHKTTSVMDQMSSVMGQMNALMEKLTFMVDSHSEPKLAEKSEPLQHNVKIPLSEDKENVDVQAGYLLNTHSMYSDMKSQLKCLKTPTAVRNRPLSAETPNTLLSNTVHRQLENLYETSETDT